MQDLWPSIHSLTQDFAKRVIALIRESHGATSRASSTRSTRARTAPVRTGAARRGRRGAGRVSASDAVMRVAEDAMAVLHDQPEGLRSETLRDALDVDRAIFAKAMRFAVAEGKLKQSGVRRRTTYRLP